MVAVLLAALSQPAGRDVPVSTAAEFGRALAFAKPGDRIRLAPGTYRGVFSASGLRGTADAPVRILGADPRNPPVLVGKTTGLKLSAVEHVELRDLVIDGFTDNGLNVDDAGRFAQPSHHVTLVNVRVQGNRPEGNRDGIKLSGVTDSSVLGCTVEGWGRGGSGIDMVGCHRVVVGGCKFARGGFNGVQAKGGSSGIRVVKCRFADAADRAVQCGGSTGLQFFRPPLTEVPAGRRSECRDMTVEGCAFSGGEAAVSCVGADGVTIRFNTVYRPGKWFLRILQETTADGFVPCRNGVVEDNVVVFRSDNWAEGGVNVGGTVDAASFRFARNLWFCEDAPGRSKPRLPSEEADEVVGQDPLFIDAAAGDFTPKPGSPATGRGAAAFKGE
jgi:hypothetical protein